MLRAVPLLLMLICVCPCQAEEASKVSIRFLGGAKQTPLADLKVTLFLDRGDYSEDMKKPVGVGTADMGGAARFNLALGRYYVELDSAKEFPYLSLPAGYQGHPSHYRRTIRVAANRENAFDFNLADACRLTLKAVDADTGKGLPGVEFVTENATGEQWGISIHGDNLGAMGNAMEQTDADGNFTRLMGPRPGFTYFAWPTPAGYELVGPAEVEIPTAVGTEKAEHVFKFRKKK